MESPLVYTHGIGSFFLSFVFLHKFMSTLMSLCFSCFFLWQNIVLIIDPEDSKSFYPRFNLEDTSSFSDLDKHMYLKIFIFFSISKLVHFVRDKLWQHALSLLWWRLFFFFLLFPSYLFFSVEKISFSHPISAECANYHCYPMMQQKCSEETMLWLLLPSTRDFVASKCFKDITYSLELLRYAGSWRRSRGDSFMCSSCMTYYCFPLHSCQW